MKLTVRDVMDRLMEPVGRVEPTVDKLVAGSPDMAVKGIATTFCATHHVLEQAITLGVNLIISHEGTYYSHQDSTAELEQDPVFLAKRRLIEQSGIAIFRFHDYVHRYKPDGIMEGLIQALEWDSFVEEHQPAAAIVTMPAAKAADIAGYVKARLGLPYVRIAGDMSLSCTRIGLLAGYRGGGAMAIPLFETARLDLIIAGEGPEWETPEYVRDAIYQGRRRAFIALGHAASEEPGMKLLAARLHMMFPGLPVCFLPEQPCFAVI